MAGKRKVVEDVITNADRYDTTIPRHQIKNPVTDTMSRNAFTELMSSPHKLKPKLKPISQPNARSQIPTIPSGAPYTGRNALGAYMVAPTKYQKVIYHNNNFVTIHDCFPKSSVHVLLLPFNSAKTLLHPLDAFEDPEFLISVKAEVKKLKTLVASELRRLYGKDSATEQARIQAMQADPPPDVLPPGRDWEKEIITGIHSGPSMNHLHVHVLSIDRFSVCMKHRKHYNSFSTPFLIDVEDFPLGEDDVRRHPGGQGYLRQDLVCWRCRKNFGNKFVELKAHLADEFEEWKRL